MIGQEPGHLFIMQPTDAHTGQLLDTVYAYAGHIDKQTLELAPTSQVVSWEQTAPDEWIYNLRPGVTFHNGDQWNAEAFQVYAQFAGDPASGVGAYAHTGPYTVEVVDELTARVKCGAPCPIFARAMNIVQVHAPSDLKEKDFFEIRIGVGVGPYQIEDWVVGQHVLTSKFKDFVPVPENPEYAAPVLNEIEWQWRGETTVRAAMIETGEADWAFLLTLEDSERLGPDHFVTGGTAEIAQFTIDTVFDPWLSQLKMRQAIVHSIDCPAIVASLYQGATTCRGNHGAPGVLGTTPENLKPYEYDPQLSRRLLEEIGYICGMPNSKPDCKAEIEINSRAARIPRNTELVESMATFMREAGINAKANFVETSLWTEMGLCGVGHPEAQIAGWQGATETKAPTSCCPPDPRRHWFRI